MISLQLHITDLLTKALEACAYDEPAFVKASDRPDLSDYQSTVALSLGKKLKTNPVEVANKLKEVLSTSTTNFDIFVAGPGFLNFKCTDACLTTHLSKGIAPIKAETPQNVIVDYGGPNVAKPMHVGHLRSSIIGEALKRLCRYKGHAVLGDIHLGDWGTQMGMLIIALQEKNPDLPYFDRDFKGPYPEASPVTLDRLQEIYPQISSRCKEDEALAEKARTATYELQNGRPGYRALWQHFVHVSIEDMKKNFAHLNVSFEQWFGESRYQDAIPSMIVAYEKKNLVRKSDGALVIDVASPSDKKEMPPLILKKKDGGFLYATTDLATIEERVHAFDAERIIYVVDGRQRLHFEQVFRAAQKVGHKTTFDFIGFGTMNGPDNKPFKTRSGGAMRLEELIQMLSEEAAARIKEARGDLETEEDKARAQAIGVAALKFADLQHNPSQNYQFDLKKFMNFEGKTGPYLLYALVRIFVFFYKTSKKIGDLKHDACTLSEAERALMLKILQTEEVIDRAYQSLSPHFLCDFAFDIAQMFSRLYSAHPILSEKDDTKRHLRLWLCKKTQEMLLLLLDLLGISHVNKM
ncbi:MAG: arginine--tRNA ligase [Holosporaceae bacterium]|nr:MAG: arginine--tRNA ligase [Holosporaceae bacterium]